MIRNETCKNCGGWEGLHHYVTKQCPQSGVEAPVGGKQIWMTTTFEQNHSDELAALRATIATQARRIADEDKSIAEFNAGFEAYRRGEKLTDEPGDVTQDQWRVGWAWAAAEPMMNRIAELEAAADAAQEGCNHETNHAD